MTHPKPVILCILDGWGLREETQGNAVAQAVTPNFDRIMRDCPNATLTTFGPDVGLPVGQMGNSEVGHMNIGAGRVVEMDLAKINGVISRGELGAQPGIKAVIDAVKNGGAVHLCGVMSDGGVHSHLDHMIETARVLHGAGRKVVVHAFTDGRDVAPVSADKYLKALNDGLPQGVEIATISGRYYALDRDNRWERVALAYHAMVSGVGPKAKTADGAVQDQYDAKINDEFFVPTIVGDYRGMADGDAVLFLNFRADRAREILAAIGDPDFDGFETGPRPKLSLMSGFTEYSSRHGTYMDCIFPEEDISGCKS